MKMKNLNTLFKILLLVFLPGILNAQTFSDREFTQRTFPVSAQTSIEVNNKYGKIHVIPWKKDSVKFVISLDISSSSLAKLHKIKNSIHFDFTSSKYYVTAITDFGSTGNQIFTELRNLSESLIPGKTSIEVNYTVYCPEAVNLTLINKFGDIYMDDIRGEIRISLSNGDMKINSISGESQIELNFGSGIINQLSDAKISCSYADLNVKQAEKLQLVTRSSTIHLAEADLVKTDSRRDKYFITDVHTLRGSSDFSQLWVEKLSCEADLDLKFGDLTIDRVLAGFCGVTLVSDYSDINLYLQDNAVYQADIFHKKDAIINYPGNVNKSAITTIQKSEEELHSYYRLGKAEDLPGIKIQALAKCYINIINK